MLVTNRPPTPLVSQGLPDGSMDQDAVEEAALRNPAIRRALADWGAAVLQKLGPGI